MSLAAESVQVNRLGRAVLRGVSLAIREGECVSVVGPNGAGKSTLMLAMAGLLPVSGGRVVMDGRAIAGRSRREMARQVAYVPQSYEGYAGFRVADVLVSARFAHLHPLAERGAADERVICEQARACELEALMDRALGTLSAGERQKVWIASALVQEPRFLLLDEPTSALDAKYVVTMVKLLRAERERGRAVLIICHDLNVAAAVGGRVAALRDGTIAYDGPVEGFLTREHLEGVFAARFRIFSGDGGRPFVVPEC